MTSSEGKPTNLVSLVLMCVSSLFHYQSSARTLVSLAAAGLLVRLRLAAIKREVREIT